MTTLSPAAQAVLDAFLAKWADDPLEQDRLCLAAALRAAADQVVPKGGPFLMTASEDRVRHQLLAIAAELDTPSTTSENV
jgi:hypothetical protein